MGFFKKFVRFSDPFQLLHKEPKYGDEAAKTEQLRQDRIKQGTAEVEAAFGSFAPSFFDERAKSYVDYAMPQLASQYQTARNQLLTNLASRGLLSSSVGQRQASSLTKQTEGAKQSIFETGRAQAQDLERQLQDRKNAIIGQLYQSADPANARASAVSTAASFRQPSAFAPLANTFADMTNTFYTNKLIEATRRSSVPTYADLFGINPSAVNSGVISRRIG